MKRTVNTRKNITLAYWNIDGIHQRTLNNRVSKLSDTQVQADLSQFDIICLAETHCNPNDNLLLDGYRIVPNIRPKSPGATRNFGGLAVCYREELRSGIKFLPITSTEVMWFKLNKSFFNLDNDIFVCLAYMSPHNSSFSNKRDNIIELLEEDIAKYSMLGSCFICGDFNARTAMEPDYCEADNSVPNDQALPHDYIHDIPLPRCNLDKHQVDTHGKMLLDLCKATGLRILNGRVIGDALGHFTCYSHTGAPSVIDYILAHNSLFPILDATFVHRPGPYSIHCMISAIMRTRPFNVNQEEDLKPKPNRFKWAVGDSNKFQKALDTPVIKDLINNFICQKAECVDTATDLVSKIYTKAAAVAGIKSTTNSKARSRIKRAKHKQWYDIDCQQAYTQLKRLATKIRQTPQDKSLLFAFLRMRRVYKRTIKRKKASFQAGILQQLENLNESNPQAFWKLFEELQNIEKVQKVNPIPPSEWLCHFQTLMNRSSSTSSDTDKKLLDYINANKDSTFNELNFSINDKEICYAINKLKAGKSPGQDRILNEMLKCGTNVLLPVLKQLFQLILTTGYFPNSWRLNFLTPHHKKGDVHRPDNYRGISIGSHMAKLFCGILQNRLTNFINKHQLIPMNQIGFKAKCRTSDHILTLKNLIDKYICKIPRGYLYTCFIDFKSAFDTVWRTALMYKLVKLGICGNFFNVIHNMYSRVEYTVKVDHGITDTFSSTVGVKQGCVLSPTLFNLYVHDLPSIFDHTCDPVLIRQDKLSCLMFADDVLLLSESAHGLQNSLTKVQEYCDQWNLTVNINKTKIMIFNKGGHQIKKYSFFFNGQQVENTKSYCYLGIIFTPSGSFNTAMQNLTSKALKVFFKLKQYNIANNIQTAIKLFDSLVLPIARYASEVWSPFLLKGLQKSNLMQKCDAAPIEKLNVKLCKYLLGVRKNSCNAAVKGELGRHPLLINLLQQSLKYWFVLTTKKGSSIVGESYTDIYESLPDHPTSWTSCVKSLMHNFGLEEVWASQDSSKIGPVIDKFTLNVCRSYEAEWLELLKTGTKSGNKLRTYGQFKSQFSMENYVLHIKNTKARKLFTSLRISNHTLCIETGRYTRPKTPPLERLCTMCSMGEVEDEKHLILQCPTYAAERSEFLRKMQSILALDTSSQDNLFNVIMSCNGGDVEVIDLVVPFVDTCLNKRAATRLVQTA